MRPIHRPALTAAANCLRSIFQNTDKRHICITGSRGIGKTALLRAAFPELPCAGAALLDGIGFCENDAERHATLRLFAETRVIAALCKDDPAFCDAVSRRDDVLLIDLDEWYARCESTKLGCILLASGFSTRFNSNKLLADFRGKPLVTHTMSALSRAAIGETAVVTRYDAVRQLAEEHSLRSLLHDRPALSDTIRLGVGSFGDDTDGYMLCVADQPLLTAETLQTLAAAFALEPSRIIRPRHADTPGNPVIFPAALKQDLLMLSGEQGGRAVIKKHPELLRFTEIADPSEFMDVDTAEALLQLQ